MAKKVTPKKRKPRDINRLASRIVEEATGARPTPTIKDSRKK